MAPRDLVLLGLLSCMWGISYLFIGIAVEEASPVLLAAIRFDAVGVVLLAVALLARRQWRPRGTAQWTAAAVGGALNIALYHALLFWGQLEATPGIAALIVGFNPILTAAASRLLLPSERIDARTVAGLALGFAGVAVLALLKGGHLFDAQGMAELAIFGAILAWAVGTVLMRRTAHTMPILPFVAWQALLGAAVLHGLSLAFEPAARLPSTLLGWTGLAYLVTIASCIGLLLFFHLMHRIGPIRSNLVSYGSAIVAAAAGWVVLELPVEPRAFAAFALIVAGFALVATAKAPASSTAGELPSSK